MYNQLQFSNYANLGALSTRNMSKFSLARAVWVTAEGSADAAVAPAAAAAVDEVGEITLEQKGALEGDKEVKIRVKFININVTT